MKQKLSLWQKVGLIFYRKRSMTALVFLLTAGFGLISYTSLLRREGFPSVNVPLGVVQVVSFNKTAQEIDKQFVEPIVAAAQKDQALKDVVATSDAQGAGVTVFYESDTDVQGALDKIKNELGDSLPADARVLYIKVDSGKLTTEGDDILVSVHSDSVASKEIDEKAKMLAGIIKSKSALVSEVHLYPSFESVTDLETGNSTEQQVRFDRFYDKEHGEVLPSSIVGVKGVDGADQLALYDEINAIIESEEVSALDVDSAVSASFAESIREQISGLQRNLLEGLAVVLVVSFVLISFRSSIVTAVSMASTVLITVGVLNLVGYSLNTITLFSLVLCLALIVDDTTIMVEAIDAGLKKDKKFKDVVTEAMGKVSRASATGTLTTMLAFAPMLFIGGILGEFVRAIPVTIIISLAVSITVSFIFIPLMMRLTYGTQVLHKTRKFSLPNKIESRISGGLARLLVWSDTTMRRRLVMRLAAVCIGIAFLMGGGLLFSRVGFNIFPAPKDGVDLVLSGRTVNQEQANLAQTEEVTDKILQKTKEILGDNLESMTLTGQNGSADKNGFSASLRLTNVNERDQTSVSLADKLNQELAGVAPSMRVTAEAAGVGPPAGSFTVQLNGNDETKAYALADEIKQYLSTLELKRPDSSTAQLINSRVTPRTQILRDGDERIVSVSADFNAKDTSALVVLAQEAVEKEFSPERLTQKGYPSDIVSFDFGQEEENQESFSSMGQAAGPLLLAMFVAMAILFRSLAQPVLIMLALPFAIFGVASGLYITNNEISFFTMLGVFALVGISVNNTILLTDYANQAKTKNNRPSDAMSKALSARLRPLITTSTTSILALLPLALNDPFWEGIAYTLIFGLMSSTILTLTIFPYYYLIMESLRAVVSRKAGIACIALVIATAILSFVTTGTPAWGILFGIGVCLVWVMSRVVKTKRA